MEKSKKATFATIDAYIAQYPPEKQEILHKIRKTIREAAPEATEKISWQMPTFHQKENLIHFAMQKNHIGIYPGGEAVGFFGDKLSGYKTSKGAVQLPLSKPIPYDLIRALTLHRVAVITGEAKG